MTYSKAKQRETSRQGQGSPQEAQDERRGYGGSEEAQRRSFGSVGGYATELARRDPRRGELQRFISSRRAWARGRIPDGGNAALDPTSRNGGKLTEF